MIYNLHTKYSFTITFNNIEKEITCKALSSLSLIYPFPNCNHFHRSQHIATIDMHKTTIHITLMSHAHQNYFNKSVSSATKKKFNRYACSLTILSD